MLKRICDLCEKEIQDDAYWYSFKVNKMKNSDIFCNGGYFELCEHCSLLFKSKFADKT